MEKLIVFALLLMTMVPLVIATKRSKKGKSGKGALITNICMFFALGIGIIIALPLSASAAGETTEAVAASAGNLSVGTGMAYIAAALSTGLACLGAGVAVASAASAAIGASSENPSMFAKSIIFVALAEGIAIYGMLISFQIVGKL